MEPVVFVIITTFTKKSQKLTFWGFSFVGFFVLFWWSFGFGEFLLLLLVWFGVSFGNPSFPSVL